MWLAWDSGEMGILAPDPGAHSTNQDTPRNLNSGPVLKHWARAQMPAGPGQAPSVGMPGRAVLACLPFRVLAGPLRVTGSKQLSREPETGSEADNAQSQWGPGEPGLPHPLLHLFVSLPTWKARPRTPAPSVCLSTLPSASPALLSSRPVQPSSPSAHVYCVSVSVSLPVSRVPEAWSNSPHAAARSDPRFREQVRRSGCECPPVCLGRGWAGSG